MGQLTMDGMEELNENIEIVQNASNIQNGVSIQNENHNLEKLVQNLAALVITEHKRVCGGLPGRQVQAGQGCDKLTDE